jgi:two-component system, LytTR family, sensor kinase
MKTPSIDDYLNLRKPFSHFGIFVFSLIVTVIITASGKYPGLVPFSLSLFILLFVQLEVFIYLGNILFAELNFDRSPGEITRIVLIRFLIFLAGCLLAAMILFIVMQYSFLWIKGENTSNVLFNFFHYDFRGWFKSTTSGLSLGALIFIILLWQTSLKREQKLREEKLIFQNETLKNQINPHFLFNSLNTLSSLIITHPDVAERFIIRLSSIYRYILDNSQKDKVLLPSELSFISEYYDLHKVRDEEKISLNINTPDADKFEILPVSLQIVVENAIKHNMATRDNPLAISIYIEGNYIVVKNNLQKMAVQMKSTKIGLKNLAERIKILTGNELVIEETNSHYIVKIPLIL